MLKRFIAYYKPVKIIFITDMICAFAVAAVSYTHLDVYKRQAKITCISL